MARVFQQDAVLPFLDMTNTITLWLVMIVYVFDQAFAIFTSVVIGVFLATVGLVLGDVDYASLVKSSLAVCITTVVSHLASITHMPGYAIVALLVAYRLSRAFTYVFAERVDVKNAEGKVTKTTTAHPNWIGKVSNMAKGFFQSFKQKVRTGVVPTARVIPDALVTIDTKEGQGTGFRVKNYIATAAHVVGSEKTPRATWGGVTAFSHVVYAVPGKDIALLALPQEMQQLPTYKFAKTIEDGPIVLTSLDESGALAVAITEGVRVSDNITYAVLTKNGMSGSPVTNTDGKLLGVHQTNTGFTGGAVIMTDADMPGPKKSQRELELEKRIADLESQQNPMTQCSATTDLVDLVRIAVQREMEVLRKEISNEFGQAKGKTKRKRAIMAKTKVRRKRGRVWTIFLEDLLQYSQLPWKIDVLLLFSQDFQAVY